MKQQNLGLKILLARKEMGFSQEQLAKKIGVRRETIVRWEQQDFNLITIENLVKLAKVLNKPISYFVSNTEQNYLNITPNNSDIPDVVYEKKQLYHITKNEFVGIPILSQPPSEPKQKIEDFLFGYFLIRREIIKESDPTNYFITIVKGYSFKEYGLLEGDAILVEKCSRFKSGDLIFVWLEDVGTQCMVYLTEKNKLKLKSNKSIFDVKNKKFIIYGKVIYREGKI